MQKIILVTVDLEDWFQVENLRSCFPHERWDECSLRVEASTNRLLSLFEKYDVKATFFILGWLAERIPGLIRRIKAQGHEIASYGYGHDTCNILGESELLSDIKRARI